MGILHAIAGLGALLAIAGFMFFTFRQGMKVRPSGRERDDGFATGLTTDMIGGESHGGADGGGGDGGH